MTIVDERGRLAGRVNIVDAVVVAFVLALVPLGYAAYRVFRVRTPVIATVVPARLATAADARVRLSGQDFRPFLTAYVAKTGSPYSLADAHEAKFLIETPTLVELQLPALEPGSYDIHLYDLAQEITSRQSAFVVAPPPLARVDALVRFVVPRESVPLIKAGARDQRITSGQEPPGVTEDATLAEVHQTDEAATITLGGTPPTMTMTAPGTVLQAAVQVPAHKTAAGWEYKGQRLRAGETFVFETGQYRIVGVILKMGAIPGQTEGS
jgi:hypothetical protein